MKDLFQLFARGFVREYALAHRWRSIAPVALIYSSPNAWRMAAMAAPRSVRARWRRYRSLLRHVAAGCRLVDLPEPIPPVSPITSSSSLPHVHGHQL